MLVILFATMLAAQTNPVDDFHCPESYATDAERDAAVKAFDENFAKQHPQATVEDLVAERFRLLVARDCRQTLANIADNRKPEKATLQIVSPQEQSLTIAGRRFTRVDEYYDSTTRVWSIIFVDDPQHPESFANQLILNFYDWTPKPTSEAVAMALSGMPSNSADSGDCAITIVVSDAVTYVYQSFAVLVTRAQPAPTLAPIPDTNTTVNIPVKVTLTWVVALAAPVVAAMITQTLINQADHILVGHLPKDEAEKLCVALRAKAQSCAVAGY